MQKAPSPSIIILPKTPRASRESSTRFSREDANPRQSLNFLERLKKFDESCFFRSSSTSPSPHSLTLVVKVLLPRNPGLEIRPRLPDTTRTVDEIRSFLTCPIPGAPGFDRTASPPTLTEATVPRPVLA